MMIDLLWPREVVVLVPCRNEAGNIPRIVNEFLAHRKEEYELLFVEGNSDDETFQIGSQFARRNKDSNVSILKQSGNGKFDAILTGIKDKRGKLIVIWDGDVSVGFKEVRQAIDLSIAKSVCVLGNRFKYRFSRKAMPILNHFGNKCFSILARIAFGFRIEDILCGLKIFPASSLLDSFNKIQVVSRNDTFGDLSIVLSSVLAGNNFENFDVHYSPRTYGQSNLKRFNNGRELLRNLLYSFLLVRGIKK